ncbi:hypothetical protein C5167_042858 [Papaver somniferum]|uniref:Uncharacterized protein n=1 Tax=Papaver somniferum TaxID=3469 RepID=A0A4Y7L766_PAPSO|nr:hypothetical protein C5167_042858 [Papaver somniferum]
MGVIMHGNATIDVEKLDPSKAKIYACPNAHKSTSTLSAIHTRTLGLLRIIRYLDLGSHYHHWRLGSIGRVRDILPRGCGFDSHRWQPT